MKARGVGNGLGVVGDPARLGIVCNQVGIGSRNRVVTGVSPLGYFWSVLSGGEKDLVMTFQNEGENLKCQSALVWLVTPAIVRGAVATIRGLFLRLFCILHSIHRGVESSQKSSV